MSCDLSSHIDMHVLYSIVSPFTDIPVLSSALIRHIEI